MVTLRFTEETLVVEVEGWDKLWSMKGSLEIPLAHIAGVRTDPPEVHDWWRGVRLPGTYLPGVVTAGTFHYHGQRVFWDVHDPSKAIGIALHDERYAELIVEVEDPEAAVAAIKTRLGA